MKYLLLVFLVTLGTTLAMKPHLNVYGQPLKTCSLDPLTGYFRSGKCTTGETDYGTHIVCAQVTNEFLEYSKSKGNDLISPAPMYNFPGLKEGDH